MVFQHFHDLHKLSGTCHLTRDAWVSAKDLRRGEQLRGLAGPVYVADLAPLPSVERVYNFTVEGEHCDRVSTLGALVHNNGCSGPTGGRAPSAQGTLTAAERAEIQAIANKYNTQIDVVGSRAAGQGRNVGSKLPVGKGPGTRSDIDFRIDTSHPQASELIKDLQKVGNGAGSAGTKWGTNQRPTYPPSIQFPPKK